MKVYVCKKCLRVYSEKHYKYIIDNQIMHENFDCCCLKAGFVERRIKEENELLKNNTILNTLE